MYRRHNLYTKDFFTGISISEEDRSGETIVKISENLTKDFKF